MVNKKTIVFLTIYPFNDDYALKYGFDILKKRGFDVVILNILNYIFDRKLIDRIPHYNVLKPVYGIEQIRVESADELKKHIRAISGWKAAVLVLFPYMKLLKVLKSEGIGYIQTFTNVAPHPYVKSKIFIRRIWNALKRLMGNPVEYISESLVYRLPPYLLRIDYPQYVVFGSEESNYTPDTAKTKVIHAHSFDYDRYLRNIQKPKPEYLPEGKYYVHIANHMWGLHDNVLLNIKAAVRKDEYERSINYFFDYIENHTGNKIIIAAYPKATEDENIYRGRPFLYNTEQLIKYSSGVFCHYSGAIKFALIHKKPICFISLKKIHTIEYERNNFQVYTSALGAEINFIDNDDDIQKLLDNGIFYYNDTLYEDYVRKYITYNRSNSRLLWDIVADTLISDANNSELVKI